MKKLFLVLMLFLCFAPLIRAQKAIVKTNLLYGWLAQSPNLGLEVKLGNRLSLDVSGGYNWFNLKGSFENNRKMVHWLVQPELRYWLGKSFDGHYFGAHLLGSQYNISQHKLSFMFGSDSDKYRYEGWGGGAGLSYGYQLPFAKRWSLEFSLGVGYAYMKYDKYLCPKCGNKEEKKTIKHYLGPTKAAISLVFILK